MKTIDEINKWKNIFSKDCTIWKIEFEESNCIIRDSNLLHPGIIQNNSRFFLKDSFQFGYNYWNGCYTQSPRLELLIKPPIKII